MKTTLTRSLLLSIILHAVAIGMLLISLDLTPTLRQPVRNQSPIIDAVAVNNEQVEQELTRIKELEQQKEQEQANKQAELERQLRELQKKSTEVEQKRIAEEKRLVDLKQRQQEEEKLALVKQQQEELQQQREAEEQRLKQEELRLAEEENKRREAEEALKQKLAEEQRQLQEAQDKEDLNVINSYVGRIANAIEREFNTAGLPPGMSCVFQIRMIPGGDVVEARIDKSSGNTLFDSRAEIAVKRASPLPVPDNPRIFAKMRVIRVFFAPN